MAQSYSSSWIWSWTLSLTLSCCGCLWLWLCLGLGMGSALGFALPWKLPRLDQVLAVQGTVMSNTRFTSRIRPSNATVVYARSNHENKQTISAVESWPHVNQVNCTKTGAGHSRTRRPSIALITSLARSFPFFVLQSWQSTFRLLTAYIIYCCPVIKYKMFISLAYGYINIIMQCLL